MFRYGDSNQSTRASLVVLAGLVVVSRRWTMRARCLPWFLEVPKVIHMSWTFAPTCDSCWAAAVKLEKNLRDKPSINMIYPLVN